VIAAVVCMAALACAGACLHAAIAPDGVPRCSDITASRNAGKTGDLSRRDMRRTERERTHAQEHRS
jgi:hypothetical protein